MLAVTGALLWLERPLRLIRRSSRPSCAAVAGTRSSAVTARASRLNSSRTAFQGATAFEAELDETEAVDALLRLTSSLSQFNWPSLSRRASTEPPRTVTSG